MDRSSPQNKGKRKHYDVREPKVKDPGEIELERLVFGQAGSSFNEVVDESSDNDDDSQSASRISNKKTPLWEDEDDVEDVGPDKTEVGAKKKRKSSLEKKFIKVAGTPSWAKLNSESLEKGDPGEDLIRVASNKIRKSRHLPSGNIDISVCKNLIFNEDGWGPISSIEFHSQLQVALIGCRKDRAIITKVDGTTNSVVQTIKFDFHDSLKSAQWTADGKSVIACYPKKNILFLHDVVAGKTRKIYINSGNANQDVHLVKVSPDGDIYAVGCHYGYVHLLSSKTNEILQTLKMNTTVNDLAFNATGNRMYCFTDEGIVHVWDMNSRECIHQFQDEGQINGRSIAVTPDYLACGSSSGVVNIYDRHTMMSQSEPTPDKSIFNLTTNATAVRFNSTSEILALASLIKDNSVRLYHVPSHSTFANFPLPGYVHGRVSAMDFSPSSGYFSVGSHRGSVNLYRLVYFDNY